MHATKPKPREGGVVSIDTKTLTRHILPLLLAAAALLFGTATARADYRFCNATSYVLEGAIGDQVAQSTSAEVSANAPAAPEAAALAGGRKWQSSGWTLLLPGECKSVLSAPLVKGDYFVFARSINAHQGPTKYFSGNARFCTLPETFEIIGRENCAMRGYDSHDFIRVTVKSNSEWTTTFREPRDYSLSKAKIAGVQRLLKDNGLHLPKIDGYAAKNTQRAVEAFQRSIDVRVTGTIDQDLLEELIKSANKEQAKFGLNLCNNTPHLVWAAIGVGEDEINEDISSGWIRVPPGACTKAIKDKLIAAKTYYLYAEATSDKGAPVIRGGRPLKWAGKHTFCVKTARFEISGSDACAARGYDERPFMRIDTGSKAFYELPLQ